jgi:hypothetical protein
MVRRHAVPFAAMTFSAVLLRVLLSLALVLNGIGSAVAAVHAHAGHAGHEHAPAMAMADGAPCHDQAPLPPAADDGAGDCCHGARCHCACTAPGATVAAIAWLPQPQPPVAPATHRLEAGHRAPALAHPIRPPIG